MTGIIPTQAEAALLDEPVTDGVAKCYWFRSRRFFNKRSAYAAKARAILSVDHEYVSDANFNLTGERCLCDLCSDSDGKALRALTRELMRVDR